MHIVPIRLTTCILAIGLLNCVTARADFTLLSPPPQNEASISSIFESFYSPGTAWYPTGARLDGSGSAVDLTNGALLATRVDDFDYPGLLDASAPYFGQREDQHWSSLDFDVVAVARYAGYSQRFGYDLDGDDAGYINLFDVQGSGVNVTGSAHLTLNAGQSLAWQRDGNQGGTWSSSISDNYDGTDHMITYRVTGYSDDLARWMLFWEDKPSGGDRDYNDLAVQVSTRYNPERCIPEPGMGVTVVLACGIYMLIRRRDW